VKRIILCGITGAGKSTITNHILGQTAAVVGNSTTSETSEITVHKGKWFGKMDIQVVDTMGFVDTEGREGDFLLQLARFLRNLKQEGGLTCVLVLIPCTETRFNMTYKNSLFVITKLLGEEVWQRTRFVSTMWNKVSAQEKPAIEQRFATMWPADVAKELGRTDVDCSFTPFNPNDKQCLTTLFDYVFQIKENFVPEVSEDIDKIATANPNRPLNEILAERAQWKEVLEKAQEDARQAAAKTAELEGILNETTTNHKIEMNNLQGEINTMKGKLDSKDETMKMMQAILNRPQQPIVVRSGGGCTIS